MLTSGYALTLLSDLLYVFFPIIQETLVELTLIHHELKQNKPTFYLARYIF